jgi:NAD-dependent SIR2 family protein deacetylase
MSDAVPRCVAIPPSTSGGCGGLVKPDIVFFGEGLPERFHELAVDDFPECDCLIVMGTSLMVQPFAGLIDRVSTILADDVSLVLHSLVLCGCQC